PRRGGGEPHAIGDQHADEAPRGGRAAARPVRARRSPGAADTGRPGAARLCAADSQAARRGADHPARAAHGRLGAHRHTGRLRDALSAGDPVAFRPELSAGAGRGPLRTLLPAAAAPGPGPVHRHPRARHGNRPVAASGAFRLGRSAGLQYPRTAPDSPGDVQHRLFLPRLGMQCAGRAGYRLPGGLHQPQPFRAAGGGRRGSGGFRSAAKRGAARTAPAGPGGRHAGTAAGQHHVAAQRAQSFAGQRNLGRAHHRRLPDVGDTATRNCSEFDLPARLCSSVKGRLASHGPIHPHGTTPVWKPELRIPGASHTPERSGPLAFPRSATKRQRLPIQVRIFMCGIAGEFRFDDRPADLGAIERITQHLTARGPDASGFHSAGPMAMGHRRLKIMDLCEASGQPMIDPTLGLSMVFNGAIYNYPELRAELEGLGYSLFSVGDTEVLVKGYHAWGAALLPRLYGMVACGICEPGSRQLVIARHRLGTKPLYLSKTADRLRFASSLPALLKGGDIAGVLNPVALNHYMSFHAVVPAPDTLIAGIEKMPPGHWLRVQADGRIEQQRWWSLPFGAREDEQNYTFEDWQERTLAALRESVALRQRAAVDVGVLLSGGVDSSLLVGLLREAGAADNLLTFSIGFED